MIHLLGNYYAKPDILEYTLLLDREKKDKAGNQVYTTLGHCGSLQETQQLLQRKLVRERVSEHDMELSEALRLIKDETNKIIEATKEVNKL